MFADNCVLYTEGPRWPHIRNRMQAALDIYINWGVENCLVLNAKKTKAMIVGTRGKLNSIIAPPLLMWAIAV